MIYHDEGQTWLKQRIKGYPKEMNPCSTAHITSFAKRDGGGDLSTHLKSPREFPSTRSQDCVACLLGFSRFSYYKLFLALDQKQYT